MKKKLLFIVLVPIVLLLITIGVGAMLTTRADSSEFIISDSALTGYNGQGGAVVIPSGVTKIGSECFNNNNLITSVEIPDSVSEIGYRAFADCKNLQSVTIGNGVSSISDSAFNGDTSLSNVSIGSNLSKLGNGSFAGCTSLNNIIFVSNPYFVCENGVVYNSNKSKIYQYLAGNSASKYIMPSTVSDIAKYAFWGTAYLYEVECSSNLNSIPEYSFSNCKSLRSINVNLPVRSIDISAFSDNSSLMQISLPISLSKVHSSAFLGCPSDMIVVCEDGTFAKEFATANNYLTSKVLQVDLSNLNISSTEQNVDSSDANQGENEYVVVESNDQNNTAETTDDSLTSEDVIDTVSNIVSDAFYDDGQLVSQTQIVSDRAFVGIKGIAVNTGSNNSSVYSINDYSYYGSSIDSFNFDNTITSIGKLAFARSKLTSVTIPDGVTSIEYAAFYHCDNLSEVSIPSSVTYIGEHAFDHTPWYNNWLNNPDADDFLIVGNGVLIGYKGTEENVVIPETVNTIADGVL